MSELKDRLEQALAEVRTDIAELQPIVNKQNPIITKDLARLQRLKKLEQSLIDWLNDSRKG